MHDRANILFFRQGTFSHINDRVASWLREQFPQQELVEVDILQDVIKSSRSVVYRGAAATLLTYPRRIACGDGDFRDLYYRTSYLYRAIRRMIAEKYTTLASKALFTIQTQSLYDASIPGTPHFLYTDHTHLANLKYPRTDATRLLSPRWIKLETALYHHVRRNLVMSAFVRESLLTDYGCDPAKVVVVGASPNIPPPQEPPANDGYSNRTILFVGIDWERKGGPVLIEAFRKVREQLPEARLLIAGAAPELQMPGVEVLGRVPLAEVSRLLLRSSVLALPSWREPQGINVIEAQMHGVPVVVSNVGALPEIVAEGKTGHIIPPGDSAALAAALIRLLSDPDLCRRYGEAARANALTRSSSASVSGRIGNAIRAALED